MKSTFSAMGVAVSMAVGAIAVAAVQERIPELPRPGATDVNSITLTGCVERGTGIESYTLREATAGATTIGNVTPRVPLAISSTDVHISKHVGHSVSVTGSYAKPEIATGTAAAKKPAPPPAPIAERDGTTPRRFIVKSVKMLASSCQQST